MSIGNDIFDEKRVPISLYTSLYTKWTEPTSTLGYLETFLHIFLRI